MNTNDRIRKALTGDDGHVLRDCEDCETATLGQLLPGHSCDTCNGTGFIEDRERIVLALGKIVTEAEVWTSGFRTYKVFDRSFDVPESYKGSGQTWAWENRHNQPWCEALEEFVREWREPADDYSTVKGMMVLEQLLLDSGFDIRYSARGNNHEFHLKRWRDDGLLINAGDSREHTKQDALINAVLAAIGDKK